MGCWVVPGIAAELWGAPAERVWECVREGLLPSRTEEGFVVVEATERRPRCLFGEPEPAPPPPTYVAVTAEELEALAEPGDCSVEHGALAPPDRGATIDDGLGDWRAARASAGRRRVAPRERGGY